MRNCLKNNARFCNMKNKLIILFVLYSHLKHHMLMWINTEKVIDNVLFRPQSENLLRE